MECDLHGDSSHVSSIKSARNGLSVEVEQARGCRAIFCRTSSSYSETAIHEPAQR